MANSNIGQFTRQVRKIQSQITDLRPFFRERAYPATVEEIRRLIHRQGIIRTGTYLRAATEPGHAAHVQRITETYLEVGVDLGWFETHRGAGYPLFLEHGTRRMRARPVYDAVAGSNAFRLRIERSYESWLNKILREADRL